MTDTAREAVARALVKHLGYGDQMDDKRAAQDAVGVAISAFTAWLQENGWQVESAKLREALEGLLERYTELVNCGDCGFWNPEEEDAVKFARAALAAPKLESDRRDG